jgi:hypothetical protein
MLNLRKLHSLCGMYLSTARCGYLAAVLAALATWPPEWFEVHCFVRTNAGR